MLIDFFLIVKFFFNNFFITVFLSIPTLIDLRGGAYLVEISENALNTKTQFAESLGLTDTIAILRKSSPCRMGLPPRL